MANTFKNYLVSGIGTTETVVYTVPAATSAVVIGFTLANITGATVTATAKLQKGGSAAFIVKDAQIPNGESLAPAGNDQRLVLETGNSLKVTASALSSIDAIVHVLEIT